MPKFLLTPKKYNLSARLLATKLGLKATSSVEKLCGVAPVIRYGNARGEFEVDTQINSPEGIRLCSNSMRFSEWCRENDVNSPVYTPFNLSNIPKFPFLLRRAYHIGGTDIILVKSEEDIPPNADKLYTVPFIKTTMEFGVHVINGEVIKVFSKNPTMATPEGEFRHNQKFGYHFSIVDHTQPGFESLAEFMNKVFSGIPLMFGRADVGYNSDTGEYTLFEVNTAPGLNTKTSELYATRLRGLIEL